MAPQTEVPMPELAEVAFAAKAWNAGKGALVTKVEARAESRVFRDVSPAALSRALPGSVLEGHETHGKKMLFRFSGNGWLGLHLGMTGSLRREKADYRSADRHDALVLRQEKRSLVFRDPRQFGRVLFHQDPDAPAWWRDLPPAVTSDAFTLDLIRAALARRPRTPVKAALLMQDPFPGVGNWMADEILWRARLHPARPAGSLSSAKLRALHEATVFVARGALATVGKRGGDPPEDWLFHVRWKDGGHCPATGKPLRREEVAGRTTCWCPARQREQG